MKILFFFLTLAAAFLVQTQVTLLGVQLNISAAIAYYCGLHYGPVKGITLGAFTGMIEDSIAGGLLGPNVLGKGLVGFFSSLLSGTLFKWTQFLGMVSLFLLTVLDGLVVFFSTMVFDAPPTAFDSGLVIILLQGLLNGIGGILLKPGHVD